MMKQLSLLTLTFSLSLTLIGTANGAQASAASPKQDLNISLGDYTVVAGDQSPDDSFCVKGAVHRVSWDGTPQDPVLSIGEPLIYADFNKGLKTDSQPYYKNHCSYQSSNQTESGRLLADLFTNCDNENTTDHTEIKFTKTSIEYRKEKKISRKGKVAILKSTCTLKKK
ncbi:MAG: hypothetical protein EOP05_15140 [Proteobacteria bacterium]|nr:MAG: hypothetical protein EOP05_15140 [Pseudomonadota bacterium]